MDVGGMTPAEIEEAFKRAVAQGDAMPRALHQSVEPLQQPTIIE